jgi:Altronate dehydratase
MSQAGTVLSEPLIRLNAADNVLIARESLSIGQQLCIGEATIRIRAQVTAGHKVAACRIPRGAPIRKYDTVIGRAARDIEAGDHVHTHNVELIDFERDPGFCLDVRPVEYVAEAERATFNGIVRPDGRVATRNFIGILASVNCSSTVIKNIAAWFTPERLAPYPNVDGVVAFAQTSGCGMSSPSEHFDVLRRTLAGYARHPNLAGVLIVGLGCERNQVSDLLDSQGLHVGTSVHALVMQDEGGTRATIEAGSLPYRRCCRRRTISSVARCRRATSKSVSNVAAPMAFRASRPIRPWARPWTFWCAMVVRRFFPKPLKFTVSNTC